MGVVNQYYVGNDVEKVLIDFEKFYSGEDEVYTEFGIETGKRFELYYEGKYYDLLDSLSDFAKEHDVEFYVFCNGEQREDYFYAIINKKGIFKKDVEIVYPSFRDCEDMI